jgi:hypothetical protein
LEDFSCYHWNAVSAIQAVFLSHLELLPPPLEHHHVQPIRNKKGEKQIIIDHRVFEISNRKSEAG